MNAFMKAWMSTLYIHTCIPYMDIDTDRGFGTFSITSGHHVAALRMKAWHSFAGAREKVGAAGGAMSES